jgi:hypothetical protein
VCEKVRSGIWVFTGVFRLLDAWAEEIDGRRVFKFRLEIVSDGVAAEVAPEQVLDATRVIPTAVKLQVWKRDKERCVECGSIDNLHFDHIIPWSRGGSPLTLRTCSSSARGTTWRSTTRFDDRLSRSPRLIQAGLVSVGSILSPD